MEEHHQVHELEVEQHLVEQQLVIVAHDLLFQHCAVMSDEHQVLSLTQTSSTVDATIVQLQHQSVVVLELEALM